MSKAILVIDMPKDCLYCPCYDQDTEFGFEQCKVLLRSFESVEERDNKPDWCPLISMPEKKENTSDAIQDYDYETAFNDGYNTCIDEILGEE